jgi:hypothetical protein
VGACAARDFDECGPPPPRRRRTGAGEARPRVHRRTRPG